MLPTVCNEHLNDWDIHIPYAYNNSVIAATSLAFIEVHIGCLLCLPLTASDRPYGRTHQSLDHHQRALCNLALERL